MEAHVADALAKGAQAITGGKRHALGHTFFEPTVLVNANAGMRLAAEETFGPVAPLFRFKDEAEAIAFANSTPYGLAAYFYSRDVARVWRVAEKLEFGIVGVNDGDRLHRGRAVWRSERVRAWTRGLPARAG